MTCYEATCAVIDDSFHASNAQLKSVTFTSSSARLYVTSHASGSIVTAEDVVVYSSKLWTQEDDSLFSFETSDTVNITRLSVHFQYDLAICTWTYYPYSEYLEDHYSTLYQCANPLTLLANHGETHIHDLRIYVMWKNRVNATANLLEYNFVYDTTHGFIENYGVMQIDNLKMDNSLSNNLVYNEGAISLSGISHFDGVLESFDVNALHSSFIMNSVSISTDTLEITDSHFYGIYAAFWVQGGRLNLSRCIFENHYIPLAVDSADSVVIIDCEFRNFGRFYFAFSGLSFSYYGRIFMFNVGDYVKIKNSSFSGYSPEKFMEIQDSSNIELIGNRFEVNTLGLLYDVDPYDIGFWKGEVALSSSSNDGVKLIDNTFTGNDIDPAMPWMVFYSDVGTTCFTGNELSD